MKRTEKKVWMFICLVLYLEDLKRENPLKFVLLSRYLRNNHTPLNILFNRIINKQEEYQLNNQANVLRDAANYFRNRFI